MKTEELLNFYRIQHKIFGICPHTKKFFRLSECHIYTTNKPDHDWLQKIENKKSVIEKQVKKFYEKEAFDLNAEGQKQASKIIKKIDKIFLPKRFNPKDSFGIFNPVDFVIFDGMEKGKVRKVVLYDGCEKVADRKLQNSIKNVVEQRKYKFQTLRIDDKGKVTEE